MTREQYEQLLQDHWQLMQQCQECERMISHLLNDEIKSIGILVAPDLKYRDAVFNFYDRDMISEMLKALMMELDNRKNTLKQRIDEQLPF